MKGINIIKFNKNKGINEHKKMNKTELLKILTLAHFIHGLEECVERECDTGFSTFMVAHDVEDI